MGQQQLLLVILVTILVGIATVVAINVFGTAAEDANRDAVRQDLLQGATAAQALWTRPEMMDGAGRDFTTVAAADLLGDLGLPADNENGTYTATAGSATSITITGTPSSGPPDIIAVTCRDGDGNWQVDINDETAPTPCG